MEKDYESNYLSPDDDKEKEPENMVLVQDKESDVEIIDNGESFITKQDGVEQYYKKSSIEQFIKLLKIIK